MKKRLLELLKITNDCRWMISRCIYKNHFWIKRLDHKFGGGDDWMLIFLMYLYFDVYIIANIANSFNLYLFWRGKYILQIEPKMFFFSLFSAFTNPYSEPYHILVWKLSKIYGWNIKEDVQFSNHLCNTINIAYKLGKTARQVIFQV